MILLIRVIMFVYYQDGLLFGYYMPHSSVTKPIRGVSYPLLNTNTVVDIAALDANGDINFATNRGYEEDYAGYEGYPARCVPALIRPLYKIRICEDRCINILGWAH